MRLAKYLARAGVASRRRSEDIIRQGRVQINGQVTKQPQENVTDHDHITVDGKALKGFENKLYVLLNKPAGFISTVHDTHQRPTVMSLLGDLKARLYPVGRLDADSSGVLLMTNDGELAYRLTHPCYQVKKVYHAWVKGLPTKEALALFSKGLVIDGHKSAPAGIKLLKTAYNKRAALLEITLTEGKKRQVKNMCSAINHPVTELHRVNFGGLKAGNLEKGSYRFLTESEINKLYRMVGL